jgi:hypothetical protein
MHTSLHAHKAIPNIISGAVDQARDEEEANEDEVCPLSINICYHTKLETFCKALFSVWLERQGCSVAFWWLLHSAITSFIAFGNHWGKAFTDFLGVRGRQDHELEYLERHQEPWML